MVLSDQVQCSVLDGWIMVSFVRELKEFELNPSWDREPVENDDIVSG